MEQKSLSDVLLKQIRIARKRLVLEQFLHILPWTLTICLAIAALAGMATKVFVMPYVGLDWAVWCLTGGAALGLLVALVLTWHGAKSAMLAAVELDRRFELKERVSSVLALSPEERETEAGRALMDDTLRRASGIDVKSGFGVRPTRALLIPILPVMLALLLAYFIPDRDATPIAQAAEEAAETKKQIEQSTEDLRRKMAERKKEAQEKGLNEAAGLFERVEKGTREMKDKEKSNREQALVKLNDLAKELEKRRESLSNGDEVQKQLNKMNDLKQGPADKLVESMRKGDLKAAKEELEKLKKQLQEGELNEADKDKLADQMQQMQQKLQQAADQHAQAMKDLQQQMQQAQAQGDTSRQQQLQQQMDQLSQQAPRMDQLQQMAQQLSQATQGMKDGNPEQTAQALDQMTQQLDQLQQENDELEMLDDALNQIADAKDAMNCKKCNGGGCKHCQGQQPGGGQQAAGGNEPGGQNQAGQNQKMQGGQGGLKAGRGRGPGMGAEKEGEGNFFDTQVRQQIGEGKAVITDRIDGPNVRGQVQQEVKSGITSARREESDPLEGVRLPRAQRDHAREYFDSFREGKSAQP